LRGQRESASRGWRTGERTASNGAGAHSSQSLFDDPLAGDADGKLRFSHEGDYSKVDAPISVFPKWGSTVTVKSITTQKPE
jgi:hypothetical protein